MTAAVIGLAERQRLARARMAAQPTTPRSLAGCASLLPESCAPPPHQEYLIGVPANALLPAHMVAGLVGPGSVGKSQLTVQLAVSLALSRSFLGYPVTKPRKTIIISGEDQADDYLRKFWSLMQALDLDSDDWATVRERVVIMDLTGKGVRLIEAEARGQFKVSQDVAAIAEEAATLCPDPDLIVVDTLSTMLGGAPEDVGPVSAFMSAMQTLADSFTSKPAVLVAHHTSKENAARGSTSQDAGRGSSAFGSNSRSVVVMARVTTENVALASKALGGGEIPTDIRENLRLVHAVKVKGSRPGKPLVVELVPESSGLGFAFKPYALPVEDVAAAEAAKLARAVAFRDLLEQVARETGKWATNNALVMPGRDDRTRSAIRNALAEAEELGLARQAKRGRSTVLVPLYPDRHAPEGLPAVEAEAPKPDAGQGGELEQVKQRAKRGRKPRKAKAETAEAAPPSAGHLPADARAALPDDHQADELEQPAPLASGEAVIS